MVNQSKTKFYCQECGYESLKWLGKCPGCEKWNTFAEELEIPASKYPSQASPPQESKSVCEIEVLETERLLTKINEFDRVLGGGVVPGSLILIGGDPGIGKSTLVLQSANRLSAEYGLLLYVSGEESLQQIKLRAMRVKAESKNLHILAECNLDYILAKIEELKPGVVIIDSIQTIYNPQFGSSPGSVGQVRECTTQLMYLAKQKRIAVFIIGHVTKEGAIAGPKILEHVVDTVLYFEGTQHYTYRILRAVKNRFGSTNEIGVFEMRENGLIEVNSPSAAFLSQRPVGVSGSVVTASVEGTRPILVELQALVSPTNFGLAKRETLGVDYNRTALLLAVLEKRMGLHLGIYDVFVNVAGGMKIVEPGADLGIACAVVSSLKDKPIDSKIAIVGEVGLAGEVRGISYIEKRIEEVSKLGFKKFILPQHDLNDLKPYPIELIGVKNLKEALENTQLL
ncbi:MAG: DNA repair protein RadA [Nitrospirota bacterium]